MILVLDLGSSSTRASIYDDQANAIDGLAARVSATFTVDESGRNEDDALAAFDRVVQVLDALHAQLPNDSPFGPHSQLQPIRAAQPITALGLSSYASSLVCLDSHGAPLTPVFTYADTRCAQDARRLREQHDELDALQRTGCRIRANYLPAKIAWLKRTLPDVVAQTHTFASLSDFVQLRLFGRMRAGISVASWSGLLNRETADWDDAWLDVLEITREHLPAISPSPPSHWDVPPLPLREREPELLPQWRDRWPQFAQVRCHPPVGDGAAANIGSGCIDPSRIAVTIGTTAAMRVVKVLSLGGRGGTFPWERRSGPFEGPGEGEILAHLPPALWSYRVDHTHDLIGGATTEGGNVFAWARRTLQLPNDDALETQLAGMQPDAHGLTVLPTFAGERSPGYAEDIRGTLHGLSLDTSPLDIARALIESVAYRLAHICDALRASGVARDEATLVGSGGALLASPTWCQIIADVCGLPLEIADVPEATSRGVAQLAIGNWLTSDNSLPIANSQSFSSDSDRHAIYRAAMLRQQELYAKLI